MQTINPSLKTKTISLSISLKKNPTDWSKSLVDCGFDSMEIKKDFLLLKKFQSYDFMGNPHHFISLKFSPSTLEIIYSIQENKSPALAQIDSAKLALTCLCALEVSHLSQPVFAYLLRTLSECERLLTPTNVQLEHKNSELQKSIGELMEKTNSLHSRIENDSKQLLSYSQQVSDLKTKLNSLQKIPDSMLDEIVLNWLATHDGELCMRDFCQVHSVPPASVDTSLDRLSKASKIKRI